MRKICFPNIFHQHKQLSYVFLWLCYVIKFRCYCAKDLWRKWKVIAGSSQVILGENFGMFSRQLVLTRGKLIFISQFQANPSGHGQRWTRRNAFNIRDSQQVVLRKLEKTKKRGNVMPSLAERCYINSHCVRFFQVENCCNIVLLCRSGDGGGAFVLSHFSLSLSRRKSGARDFRQLRWEQVGKLIAQCNYLLLGTVCN